MKTIPPPPLCALALLAAGCEASPTRCREDGCVYAVFVFHVEGWADLDEEQYAAHQDELDDTVRLFERRRARATLDLAPGFIDGTLRYGGASDLEGLAAGGHAIGLHGDVAETTGTITEIAERLAEYSEKLESMGFPPDHASGACGEVNWVAAVLAAGLVAENGMSQYCLRSLLPAAVPEEYREEFVEAGACESPADCHAPMPPTVEERLTPWTAASGADWLTPAPGLTLLPSNGSLACMAENGEGGGQIGCEYGADDNAALLDLLERASAAAIPGQTNLFGLTWSLGPTPDEDLLEALLEDLDEREDDGQLVWRTVPQVLDLLDAE